MMMTAVAPSHAPSAAAPAAGGAQERVRVLCVDDERQVLDGLGLTLRRYFDVVPAVGAAAGLEVLKRDPQIAVIISDMRMPGMDGATFLAQARVLAPDATRLLLTGQADLESAAAAVNNGQIFRMLFKPCPPPQLLAALAEATKQHRLVTAERVLLEQTLHGSIKVLTEILGLANPLAFGRASRIKQLAGELAAKLEMPERWQVEVAGMLSQLGAVGLSAQTVEKLYYAQPLDADEQKAVTRGAATVAQLLANIPRIELIREMLAAYFDERKFAEHPAGTLVSDGAAVLRIAADFDALEAQGNAPALAIDTLRMRPARYRPEMLQALAELRGGDAAGQELRDLPFRALRPGMVFAQDIKFTTNGVLVIPRGYEVTAGLIERLCSLRPGVCAEPVRVIVPRAAVGAA